MRRLLVIALLLLAGCVPALWVQEKGVRTLEPLNFSIQVPDGWMRLNKAEFLLITRDGALLQAITVDRMAVGKPLKYTKKKLEKGMLPQEVADIVIDNITANQDIQNYELKENIPAVIAGQPGFRITYRYKSNDGVKQKSIMYGLLYGEWFYHIRYQAPERHYFDKDLNVFEEFVNSFKLIKV